MKDMVRNALENAERAHRPAVTTHYMEEAEALSDRIGIMRDGRLLICDTAEAIKRTAGTDSFEEAFIRIVKEVEK